MTDLASNARSEPPLLEVANVSKTFGATRALRSVDLDVRRGEVHAIVGQNGSGKSTLVKILSGFYSVDDDEASVRIAGEPVHLHDVESSRAAGLRFVHQDLGLVADLNAVENLALGRGFDSGFAGRIRWSRERRNAEQRLAALGYDFDVRLPVGQLQAAERTGIAVARALRDIPEQGVLVIDEPTATLPRAEVDMLFSAVERVRAQGTGVIYISHRLDEVFRLADRVTVLRDGLRVGTYATTEIDQGQLISLMVGEVELRPQRTNAERTGGDPVLNVEGLCGRTVVDVGLNLAAGEVLGLAGLTGSGREELLSLIFGHEPRTGRVAVDGADVAPSDPHAAIAAGMGFVPPDRHRLGSIVTLSVRDNCTLTDLKRHSGAAGLLRRREERDEVEGWIAELDVRPDQPNALFAGLSGGNQQKIVLAKWLRMNPRVLLLDEPTQGVDVGAKAAIHRLARRAATAGAGVLVASSDEAELCDVCDRILILRDGEIAAELDRAAEFTPEALARAQMQG